jgi:hypothetical protein
MPRAHFGDIFRRMKVIRIEKRKPKPFGQKRSEGSFPRSRYTGDDYKHGAKLSFYGV